MATTKLSQIRRKLLRWYDKNHRDLPWRRTRHPYAIWIAETMLQQTQVTTVVPYYERFYGALPTIEALNDAPLRKVLGLWSGLGYYRRARNLKKSAREIFRNHKGRVPSDYNTLLSLPGVGDYTAGALLSIAFGKRYPALDGNARRVLTRLFATSKEKEIRTFANALVPASRPGYFNQGLMELGARICIPKVPRCHECPLVSHCKAHATDQLSWAISAKKKRTLKEVMWPLAIVRHNGKILLRRRSMDGLLAGLWELPGGAQMQGRPIQTKVQRDLEQFLGKVIFAGRIGEIRHSITNRRIRSPVLVFHVPSGARIRRTNSDSRWVSVSLLQRYPSSSMVHKAIKVLARHETHPV